MSLIKWHLRFKTQGLCNLFFMWRTFALKGKKKRTDITRRKESKILWWITFPGRYSSPSHPWSRITHWFVSVVLSLFSAHDISVNEWGRIPQTTSGEKKRRRKKSWWWVFLRTRGRQDSCRVKGDRQSFLSSYFHCCLSISLVQYRERTP